MPGDSYELLFEVKSSGEAALDQIQSKIRGVDAAGKSASSTVDGIGGSAGKAAGPVSALADQLRSAVAAINANTSSVSALTSAMDGVSAAAPRAAASTEQLTGATKRLTASSMEATAALRSLDGGLNMRSAGRFLTDVLGLGPALKAIFPIVGAIAFVEILDQMVDKAGNLYNRLNPVAQAQERSLKTLQDTNAEYDRIISKVNRLRLDEYERAHGRDARLRLEANEFSGNAAYDDAGKIRDLQNKIAEQQRIVDAAKKEIASIGSEPQYPSEVSGSLRKSSAGAETALQTAQAELVGLNTKLDNAQAQQKLDIAEASDLRAKADKDLNDKRIAEAKRTAAEITASEKSAAGFLREAETAELSGIAKIIEKRRQMLELYGKSAKAIQDINRAASIDIIHEAKKESDVWLSGALESGSQPSVGKLKNNEFSKQLRETIAQNEKDVRNLSAALDRYDKIDANGVKLEASKALRIAELTASNGTGGQSIANDTAYRIRLDLAKQLFDIEARRADRLDDEDAKEKALAEARLQYEDELDKARTDHEIKFLELQKKDLDEIHNLASGFYDAIRRGGTGVQQFFSNQAQGIGRTLFSNAFTEGYKAIGKPSAGGLIPGQTGPDGQLTTIGRILQGTPFGTNGKDAQSKTADNTARTATATEGILSRMGGASGTNGSGSSGTDNMPVPGMPGTTFSDLGQMTQAAALDPSSAETFGLLGPGSVADAAATTSSASSLLKALSGSSGLGGFTSSLGRVASQGPGALMDAFTGDSGDSLAERAGVITGAAGTTALGAMGVIQGIEQGGARGAVSAIGSGAGAVAAIAGPTPVGAIAGLVATAAAVVKGLLGDPRQARSLYESRALRDDQYFAPPTINRTTDQYGNEAGYNFMGQAHSLPFQTFSEVMPYDKYYKMPFGSGVPNVWGEVPGQIIEPYTNPQNYNKDFSTPNGTNGGYAPAQTIIHLTVQAIDPQSFADFANRNSSTFASMTSKEIKQGHPVGLAIQQAVFGT